MRTHNIPYDKENRKDIPIMAPDLPLRLILISLNYPCLEHIFMVPKVFEPFRGVINQLPPLHLAEPHKNVTQNHLIVTNATAEFAIKRNMIRTRHKHE